LRADEIKEMNKMVVEKMPGNPLIKRQTSEKHKTIKAFLHV
jgi:hypothetical protein